MSRQAALPSVRTTTALRVLLPFVAVALTRRLFAPRARFGLFHSWVHSPLVFVMLYSSRQIVSSGQLPRRLFPDDPVSFGRNPASDLNAPGFGLSLHFEPCAQVLSFLAQDQKPKYQQPFRWLLPYLQGYGLAWPLSAGYPPLLPSARILLLTPIHQPSPAKPESLASTRGSFHWLR